ncbi:hypothetical protein DL98DRAFT_40687 [Cadophora sp. DSE1049]|nr:hypothetical protein DL98DRAFT_40687 [Cadophora sp. DSE1049]
MKMSAIEEPFITLASNGMQPQNLPKSRTHDTSQASYHAKDISEFAAKLNQAAERGFPNASNCQSRYEDVEVALVRWEDDNRLGVSWELEDLSRKFHQSYGFKTTTWLIPTSQPLVDIMSKALALVGREAESSGKLLIVYYAGHAAMNSSREQVWLRTGRPEEGILEWFAIQPLFLNSKSDVLFLLDCCAAASAASTCSNIKGTKETIPACGFEARAPEPGAHSFTSELIEVLDKWQSEAFSVGMLHSELLVNLRHPKPKADMFGRIVESRSTPVHWITTSDAKAPSIVIYHQRSVPSTVNCSHPPKRRRISSPEPPLSDSESSNATPAIPETSSEAGQLPQVLDTTKYAPEELNRVSPDGTLVIPHVLVSLALEGEQILEVGAWNKWLKDCPAFVKYARVEGMYKSHSTLLMLSLPVVIWDLLPDDLACSFVGYVGSVNHLACKEREDNKTLEALFGDQHSAEDVHETSFAEHHDRKESEGVKEQSIIGSPISPTHSAFELPMHHHTMQGDLEVASTQSTISDEDIVNLPSNSIPGSSALRTTSQLSQSSTIETGSLNVNGHEYESATLYPGRNAALAYESQPHIVDFDTTHHYSSNRNWTNWWDCCKCGPREVNSEIHGDTCPDCCHQRCDSCSGTECPTTPIQD